MTGRSKYVHGGPCGRVVKDLSTLTLVGGVCKTEIYCFLESVNKMMMCIYC